MKRRELQQGCCKNTAFQHRVLNCLTSYQLQRQKDCPYFLFQQVDLLLVHTPQACHISTVTVPTVPCLKSRAVRCPRRAGTVGSCEGSHRAKAVGSSAY